MFQELEQFLEAVLIVAMSPSIGTTYGQDTSSQIKYNYVSNVIKGTTFDYETDEDVCNDEDEIDLENDCHTGWQECKVKEVKKFLKEVLLLQQNVRMKTIT